MRLFVGLGNPGAKYAHNRHNIGFAIVDEIARRHGFAPWRPDFRGVIARGRIDDESVLLLKPQTFMNESGWAVREVVNFLKFDLSDLTVFHDELELPPSRVRVKIGRGNAGHNGLASISEHVGNDYKRVRIGIGHPGVKSLVEYYVLSDFPKIERPWVKALREIIANHADLLVKNRDSTFQNKVHLAMQAKGFFDKDDDAPA